MIATGFTVSLSAARTQILTALVLGILMAAASGCEPDNAPPSYGGQITPSPSETAPVYERPHDPVDDTSPYCEDGEVRSCVIFIGEHNGVKTCTTGVSVCAEGRWSDCELSDA